MHARGRSLLGLLLASSACGHSTPVGNSDYTTRGPYSGITPTRLTYSHLPDDEASFSESGQEVVYRFQRDTPDGDHCIAALPAGGGTRLWERCTVDPEDATWAHGLGSPTLRADGLLAFTAHRGRISNLTSAEAALLLSATDSLTGQQKLMDLIAEPGGGTMRWDDLIAAGWLPTGELLAVGASRLLIPPCGDSCPRDPVRYAGPDTVKLGTELARIDPQSGQLTSLASTFEAIAAGFDLALGRVVFAVQRALPEPLDYWHEPISDTLYTVSIEGGTPSPIAGWPRADRPPSEHLHGVAAGGGRVFISRSWRRENWTPGTYSLELFSDIAEVMPDGTLVPRVEAVGWRWGNLAMSPDGRWLVAESLNLVAPAAAKPRTEEDLYLIDLGS